MAAMASRMELDRVRPDRIAAPVTLAGRRTLAIAPSNLASLTPEKLDRIAKVLSKRISHPWRQEPGTQICRQWYRLEIVEYYVGSAFGVARLLDADIYYMGWDDPCEIVVWILDVRDCRQHEYRQYLNE